MSCAHMNCSIYGVCGYGTYEGKRLTYSDVLSIGRQARESFLPNTPVWAIISAEGTLTSSRILENYGKRVCPHYVAPAVDDVKQNLEFV
jgi:hypothetical protein